MQAYQSELADMYGITDPPRVEVLREVSPAEHIEMLARCMQEAGWTVEQNEDGQWSFVVPTDQQEAFNLSSYVCEAQYPPAEQFRHPWAQEQTAFLYQFLTEEYVPCVQALGYEVSEAPTLEVFLAAGPSSWIPSAQVGEQTRAAGASFSDVEKACPSQSDADAQFPTSP
ncbi:hypothetical protein [Ornithinimicrobium panacihumi]|uniref:hypothetical protein n=1 Tax=Ornithinimicrobium panacihumi TaxID=2008449 RepID=UPI003F888420